MACFTKYKCKKCNKLVVLSGCSNSSGNEYIRKCIPVGTGSALYCEWICADCDPAAIEEYSRINQIPISNGHCPWLCLTSRLAKIDCCDEMSI